MITDDRSIVCHVDRAVDPSTTLRCAQQLSERLGLRLVVMASAPAVAPVPGLPAEPDDPLGWPQAPAVLRKSACALGADARADFRVARGDAPEALLDLAAGEAADLIAVTSTGRGPMLSGLFGRPHSTLTSQSRHPLLVVPEAMGGPTDVRHVVCGVDGSAESCNAGRVAGSLAAGLGVPLTLVHVAPNIAAHIPAGTGMDHGAAVAAQFETSLHALDRVVAELPPHANPRIALLYGDPVEQLTRVARGTHAPLFVVGARGRGPLKAAVLGSVSARLVASTERPVVIVPPEAGREVEPATHAAAAATG